MRGDKILETVLQAVTELNLDSATDEDILRISIAAEESATNLYNILSRKATNPILMKVLKDVAKEEKVHIGEFQTLLNIVDSEERESHGEGSEEVMELFIESKKPVAEFIDELKDIRHEEDD